jgi:deoxyribodipyrimidine photo-lyase
LGHDSLRPTDRLTVVRGSAGLVWFRRDLRLDDNPAWATATSEHDAVVALFVADPVLLRCSGDRRAARLLGDVTALDERLRDLGGRLLVRVGDPRVVVPAEAVRLGFDAVHVNLDVTPYATARDAVVSDALGAIGVDWRASWGTLVHRPGSVRTNSGTLSQVFTPFHRAWQRTPWDEWPEAGDAQILEHAGDPLPSATVAYPLIGEPDGDAALPGEIGALARLEIAAGRADTYDADRNNPSVAGTSGLSADLRFGTLSPRTVAEVIGSASPGRAALVRQLAWRDWYAHLLVATPDLVDTPMNPRYESIEWRDDDAGFIAWTNGRTGYPFVDAGMRQLRETGWMHSRLRMVTASFLVKNLLVDWRRGERFFRHVLIDGDVPQNVGNWQWVAGTGPDASPYNRVFNPVLQGQRFDPDGSYMRRWLPELSGLDDTAIHEPWAAGPLELAAAGVELDTTYPSPIVDLAVSRRRSLDAYAAARTLPRGSP